MGNIDQAIAAAQNWVNTHPNDSAQLALLASLDSAKGDTAKAIDLYKKALQIDPNNAPASNNLAYLMVENNQNVDVALTLAQTARRILPDSPETADTLGWVYFYKGNYGGARDLLESAVKENPDSASVQFHLGMVYSKLNDKTDAQSHLKKAIALDPNGQVAKAASAELGKLG
jgi:Flp pilus assembly protein TadD